MNSMLQIDYRLLFFSLENCLINIADFLLCYNSYKLAPDRGSKIYETWPYIKYMRPNPLRDTCTCMNFKAHCRYPEDWVPRI
jgi:hypothetical protein